MINNQLQGPREQAIIKCTGRQPCNPQACWLYQDAEDLLLEAVEGRRLKLGDEHPQTLESIKNLIELYGAWDKPDEVEKWQEKLSALSHRFKVVR